MNQLTKCGYHPHNGPFEPDLRQLHRQAVHFGCSGKINDGRTIVSTYYRDSN